jgi:hypothetical protein
MLFKINENKEVELKYSFRSAVYFEQIAGHNLDLANMSQNDLITLFYCVVIASLQKAKEPIITMLAFMDCIDDYNGGEKCIIDFGNWFVDVMKAQYEVINSNEDAKKVKNNSKKKTN